MGEPTQAAQGSMSNGLPGTAASLPWHLIPPFKPGETDLSDYGKRLQFLSGIWPQEHLGQLAPRAALLCEGSAFQKILRIPPEKLKVGDTSGIQLLVTTLGGVWGKTSLEDRYEKFEKAIFGLAAERRNQWKLRCKARDCLRGLGLAERVLSGHPCLRASPKLIIAQWRQEKGDHRIWGESSILQGAVGHQVAWVPVFWWASRTKQRFQAQGLRRQLYWRSRGWDSSEYGNHPVFWQRWCDWPGHWCVRSGKWWRCSDHPAVWGELDQHVAGGRWDVSVDDNLCRGPKKAQWEEST